MSDLVTIDVEAGVADVRLNRPDKYNALSGDLVLAIVRASAELAGRKDVRAVVLSGNGKGFCAGLDFSSFQSMAGGPEAPVVSEEANGNRGHASIFQSAGWGWRELQVPVIAAIHGVAFGGGFQVAMGADIRLARPDARLSVMEIKWGLIPDMGITQTARGIIRLDVLKELTFTGRVVEGTEAAELGLVTRICEDPLAEALSLAREIASKSPDAIRAGKKLFARGWESPPEESFSLEVGLQRGLIGHPNQVEAVTANLEKRAPSFDDAGA
jgi:enoyl-CoA hydratase/carnithine racemase